MFSSHLYPRLAKRFLQKDCDWKRLHHICTHGLQNKKEDILTKIVIENAFITFVPTACKKKNENVFFTVVPTAQKDQRLCKRIFFDKGYDIVLMALKKNYFSTHGFTKTTISLKMSADRKWQMLRFERSLQIKTLKLKQIQCLHTT